MASRYLPTLIITWMVASLAPAAEPDVLFEDPFEQRLKSGWTWLREDKETWRLQEGALEIQVEPGKANTVKNALVRAAPDRSQKKYAVEVTVTFTADPTQQYEQGGITWYHDGRPVFKLVHEHIDGDLWIIPGKVPAPSKTVDLRLMVDGRDWQAQWRSSKDEAYTTAASGMLPPPGEDQISIQCYDGPPDATHWIRFDNFRIVALPD